jgi:hypothetical protein
MLRRGRGGRAAAVAALGLLAAVLALAPASGSGKGTRASAPWLPPFADDTAQVWAVGDGADGSARGRSVGSLLSQMQVDRFLYLGDVYESGTAAEFRDNYDALFGHLAGVTAPTLGNHEFANRRKGYLSYWTRANGKRPRAWYSLSVSGWQILSLNTVVDRGRHSSQLRWLRRELRRKPQFGTCRIAFMHHPRFSAGRHGDNTTVKPIWMALRGHATMALAGHEHNYQRFNPIGGLAQVVAGMGGHERYGVASDPRLAYSRTDRSGAVRISLSGTEAKLEFVDTAGTVHDTADYSCVREDPPGR